MNSLQQCAEEFIASCLSESPTGQIRLMESILERNNMRRAVREFTNNILPNTNETRPSILWSFCRNG